MTINNLVVADNNTDTGVASPANVRFHDMTPSAMSDAVDANANPNKSQADQKLTASSSDGFANVAQALDSDQAPQKLNHTAAQSNHTQESQQQQPLSQQDNSSNNSSTELKNVARMPGSQGDASLLASSTVSEHAVPIHLSFHNISKVLDVPAAMIDPTSKEKFITRKLLDGVSGEVRPNEVVALMGPSGSGKTTLLNTLAGRNLAGVTGNIYLNQIPFHKSMKRKLAYVMQTDLFFERLTVFDQLKYTALLRLSGHLTRKEKVAQVNRTIDALGIRKCANTPIMLISGGEKKRVNIGTELLTDPSLIFLDEPTSGLDSTSAVALISTLRDLAKQGKTIITSIHQPSSQVFQSFDRLILLADGRTIFNGKPSDAMHYFAELGHPCPAQYNMADHIMDLVNSDPAIKNALKDAYEQNRVKSASSPPRTPQPGDAKAMDSAAPQDTKIDVRSQDEGNNKSLLLPNKQLSSSSANLKAQSYLTPEPVEPEHQLKAGSAESDASLGMTGGKWTISWFEQFRILTSRAFKLSGKDQFTRLNIIQAFALAVMCGICWFRMSRVESTVNDRSSFVFFVMTFWPLHTLFSALMAFPFERAVTNKERASGSYRLSAYFMAKTAADSPLKLVLPALFLLIAYWMANINPRFDYFLGFVAAELCAVMVAESQGLLIGASVQNLLQGFVIASVGLLGLMLVGGFFIQNLPNWLTWSKYLSFFTYSFDASRQFMFGGSYSYQCNLPAAKRIIPRCATQSTFSGDDALDYLGANALSTGANFGCLIAMIIGFRFLAYIALRFVKDQSGRA